MRYVARKVVLFLVTLWAAITLNFILPRLMPGSPVDAALAKIAAVPTFVSYNLAIATFAGYSFVAAACLIRSDRSR